MSHLNLISAFMGVGLESDSPIEADVLSIEGDDVKANPTDIENELNIFESGKAANDTADALDVMVDVLEGVGTVREGLVSESGEVTNLTLVSETIISLTMENYADRLPGLVGTSISMEGLADTLKNIWEAIKKALVAFFEKMKDFFLSLFKGIDQWEKRARALVKSNAKNGPLEISNLSQVAVAGEARIADVIKGVDNLRAFTENVVDTEVNIAEELNAALSKVRVGTVWDTKATEKIRDAKDVANAARKKAYDKRFDLPGNIVNVLDPESGLVRFDTPLRYPVIPDKVVVDNASNVHSLGSALVNMIVVMRRGKAMIERLSKDNEKVRASLSKQISDAWIFGSPADRTAVRAVLRASKTTTEMRNIAIAYNQGYKSLKSIVVMAERLTA